MIRIVILLFIFTTFSTQTKAIDQYVFAVKGGISLGSYEAGLNWAYIEQLRLLRAQHKAELNTFVGASAGSVNTLLSALRYCQKDDSSTELGFNLFQKTWDVGIQDFLDAPDSNNKSRSQEVNHDNNVLNNTRDGIFSLKGLSRSLRFITQKIESSKYLLRDNCQINIGISVTKLVPDTSKVAGIDVLNQRYIFPLNVTTKNGSLIFSNLNAQDKTFKQQDNYLYLPESNGEVSLHDILKIILASSAYPLTFPAVELQYCKEITAENISPQSVHCPDGFSEHKDQFIDGGIFDNAPIGAAMKINDPNEEYKDSVIILINPNNRRRQRTQSNAAEVESKATQVTVPGLKEYLELGYYIFDHGMSTEMYQTARNIERLQRKSNSGRPVISITNRYYPVVGDYLLHFGAFFDRNFRQHDFWMGIYDGVINLAENSCIHKSKQNTPSEYTNCMGAEVDKIIILLKLREYKEFTLFSQLTKFEFPNTEQSPAWQWLSVNTQAEAHPLLDIAHAIDENNCYLSTNHESCKEKKQVASFDGFLKNIKQQDPSLSSYEKYTRHIINDRRGWKYPIFNTAIDKLHAIEQEKYVSTIAGSQDRTDQKNILDLLKMSIYVGKTYFSKNETGLWPNSTLSNPFWSISSLVPDEIGISYRQTSIYAKYKSETLLSRRKWPIGFESRFIPINWGSRTREAHKYMGAEFVLKSHVPNPLFSTIGIGYGYYNVDIYHNDLNKVFDSFTTPLHGIILDLGAIAGKVKVSLIYRGSQINKDNRGYVNWAVNLGLSDIKGLRWLW